MSRSLMFEKLVKPVAVTTLLIGSALSGVVSAGQLIISPKDGNGDPVTGFRYIVEQDPMYKSTIGEDVLTAPTKRDQKRILRKNLSFNFHKSHTPLATDRDGNGLSGETDGSSVTLPKIKNGEYFVSVLPYGKYQLGGAPVSIKGKTEVEVRVNNTPIPTAQISIQVFEDNSPINGAIDVGERGLSGSTVKGKFIPFHIILEDPAGQYGAGGGRVAYDAFGNPLGTTYNTDGSVASFPEGTTTNGTIIDPSAPSPIIPDDNGYLVIKNLPPGKYGVQVVPPPGAGWIQTSTIEGTKVVDAWVKANEPENFVEFGPPGPHVFIGFVRDYDCNAGKWGDGREIRMTNNNGNEIQNPDRNPCIGYSKPAGTVAKASVSGTVVDNHMSRSPSFVFSNGTPFPGCRIGINLGISGKTIYSGGCDDTSSFTVNNLPEGDYSLSIYDLGLDAVIANHPFTIGSKWLQDANGDYLDADGNVIQQTPEDKANGVIPANAVRENFTVTALTQALISNPNGGAPNTGNCKETNVCELGKIPVFNWFHKMHTNVFIDENENGIWDAGEGNANADSFTNNIRWRDGRIYQSVAVDIEGAAPFDQVFPFFHWLVLETDFAKFKATGATVTVDAGGPGDTTKIDCDGDPNTDDMMTFLECHGYVPQSQKTNSAGEPLPACTDDLTVEECTSDGGDTITYRGQQLTFGMQGFLGQKSVVDFGKAAYGENENGGISGMAIYAITRAEHDPRYAVAEIWEPGIPRVQFALYTDENLDEIPDYRENGVVVNGTDTVPAPRARPADVDNYPLGWFACSQEVPVPASCGPGPEDFDNNTDANGGRTGLFDYGDAVDVTWSDSWDDSLPTNCQGLNNMAAAGVKDNRCMDSMRNWNQVRPGVFDGGYAFPSNPNPALNTMVVGHDGNEYLDAGYYVVHGFAPPGYEDLKEESKNVDFGDEYTAAAQMLPPTCVGEPHEVPALMTFVTDADGNPIPEATMVNNAGETVPNPDYTSPFAGDGIPDSGDERPLCNQKLVLLTDGKNAATDIHFFTEVPKASHVVGGILNDLANEFNPNAPTFGEKFAPPWLPVAFYDWTGHEVTRVYADQYGKYNAMVPSTYTANAASPSGFTPNMLTACMNDGGYIDHDNDPSTLPIVDPNYNPQYTQFCYTFQYMPGATTYLDTPVLQMAAFAGSGYQLDCDEADTTPMIASVHVDGRSDLLPFIGDTSTATTITLNSVGKLNVLNPASTEFAVKFIERDYGFGVTEGKVVVVAENGDLLQDADVVVTNWVDGSITFTLPANIDDGQYQVNVVSSNGYESAMGISLMVENGLTPTVVSPDPSAGARPLQAAIDAASAGDLILVAPGVYDEMVIMTKPIRLQGAGAYSTTINARAVPAEKVQAWKDAIAAKQGEFSLLNGQAAGPLLFDTEEGPGIFVAGLNPAVDLNPAEELRSFANNKSSIDGFTITGASTGGGIFMNGYVQNLTISNNRVTGNEGTYGGGIRSGHYGLIGTRPQGNGNNQQDIQEWSDTFNDGLKIHHNQITKNGAQNGVGGGIALYNGSDNYEIANNLICGNFAATDGAGIGHLGVSNNGSIHDNDILFNQSFRQMPGFETDGGGILIAGKDGIDFQGVPGPAGNGQPGPVAPTGRSSGSGNVVISRNRIQGNQAGAGDGGGIALRRTNGVDVRFNANNNRADYRDWYQVKIENNTIVNNVTGLAGGAISMKDAVRVEIVNNTIANNMSSATAGAAFEAGNPSQSMPQIAGIASYGFQTLSRPPAGRNVGGGNSPNQLLATPAELRVLYTNPLLENNILWQNESRVFVLDTTDGNLGTCQDPNGLLCNPSAIVADAEQYKDLGVVGRPGVKLNLTYSLLTPDPELNGFNDGYTGVGVSYADPTFVNAYLNGSGHPGPDTGPSTTPAPAEFQTILVAPALDEGGNWIDVRYAPLSVNDVSTAADGTENGGTVSGASDYHLTTGSAGDNVASGNRPQDTDIDGDSGGADMGSDEVQ